MTKAKNKLKDDMARWLIDNTVGIRLMPLAALEPDAAAKLAGILKRMIQDMYILEKYRGKDGKEFVTDATKSMHNLTDLYIQTKAAKYIKEGIPEKSSIITSSQMPPRRAN